MFRTITTFAASLLLASSAAAADPAALPATPSSSLATAVDAYERVMAQPVSFKDDESDRALHLLEAAAAAEPSESKWPRALSRLCDILKREEDSKRYARKAVELGPNDAENHYALGNAIFDSLGNAGITEQMSGAGEGKKAYLRAIELNWNHVESHYALGQFYLRAPGIAGGSNRKAREQGEAMLKIQNGAFLGHLLLAQIAADDEKWNDMTREYQAARDSASNPAEKRQAVAALAGSLMRQMKDPKAAMPAIEEYVSLAEPNDTTAPFLLGQAKQALKDYPAAIEQYLKVLALRPEAQNTRYSIAQCYAEVGDKASAIAHYEEFLKRFPKDDRAGDAQKALKKLRAQ